MNQRGRRSAASLTVIASLPGQTLPPPSELTTDQAALSRQIVATKPADWFGPDSAPLLVAYVRHITTSNRLAALINSTLPEFSDKAYATLVKLHQSETAAIVRLAQSMRLSQLARYRADSAAVAHDKASGTASAAKPWEVHG
jgi:hypothetical protein